MDRNKYAVKISEETGTPYAEVFSAMKSGMESAKNEWRTNPAILRGSLSLIRVKGEDRVDIFCSP